ncbi:MAG: DUF302 domain-containing protein [Salinisphaera sp.]|nr:DUF302 domain-containing protein [Salinisphaera sp.]
MALASPMAAVADTGKVTATPLAFKTVVPGGIESARMGLVSALQGQNYMIINVLDVQKGLENQYISAEPTLLIEFINLAKAYKVTESNKRFELFAPLRAALFQRQDKVIIFMLRPRFIKTTLLATGLSADAQSVLDGFDSSLREVMKTVASGGF